ncbi:hypothetical protein DRF69_11075 [Chryseobacterium sp. 5_R23647]|nr:hypothetical protein DRF69_11075 [Chryseobacterium sp. 5_R23647]
MPHQGFQVAKAKHFNDRSAKVWVKKAVFPKCVEGPIIDFAFFITIYIDDVTIRAWFQHWFTCVSTSG